MHHVKINTQNASCLYMVSAGRCDGMFAPTKLLTHVNDAITTHYDHSMMCNDAVTAP